MCRIHFRLKPKQKGDALLKPRQLDQTALELYLSKDSVLCAIPENWFVDIELTRSAGLGW